MTSTFIRGEAQISHAARHEVDWMIARHYLAKWPAVVRCVLAIRQGGRAVGCVVYAEAPRETSRRYGAPTWELARLWIDDVLGKNAESWAISASVRHVGHEHPEVRRLVSYADPAAGHTGAIYRAANWIPDGMTDDERKTPRFDYAPTSEPGLLDGPTTGAAVGRRSHVKGAYVRIPRVSKFRYTIVPPRVPVRRGTLWTEALA